MINLRFKAAVVAEIMHNKQITSIRAILVPECSKDCSKNRDLWQCVPSGILELMIDNPNAFEYFKHDRVYKITISEDL